MSLWMPQSSAVYTRRLQFSYTDQRDFGEMNLAADDLSVNKGNTLEAVQCQSCQERKYQDGSDDPSVSFQTPTRIDPAVVESQVRAHVMEHVGHEQARAEAEDKKVISQSVTLHTGICEECGRIYISGGTTKTVTKEDPQKQAFQGIFTDEVYKGNHVDMYA